MNQNQDASHNPGKTSTQIVHIEHTTYEPDPPHPEEIQSKFKNLDDWLNSICDGENPEKPIEIYRINIFLTEPSGDRTIYLLGENTYNEGNNHSITRIEYEPSNMYYNLKNEYKKLTWEELKIKITFQVKEFTKSDKFKASFLSKANAIIMGFSGESIWKK
ncbi:MAG TPA: hypothetical protein VGG71_12015 [Chitinophagaceae bacterium]|jgi:hypothetical protein